MIPGQDAIKLLGLDEATIEINVTPDRGYSFSIRGVAREYSHATDQEFRDPAGISVSGTARRRLRSRDRTTKPPSATPSAATASPCASCAASTPPPPPPRT